MATLILTAVGQMAGKALIGGAIGGALGGLAGSLVANALFAEDQHQEGSRLDDLGVSAGGADGASIPLIYGTMRVAGQFIVADDLVESKETTTVSGGKGSGPSVTQTTYTYSMTYAVAFAEPPTRGRAIKIWNNRKLTEDYSGNSTAQTEDGTQNIYYYDGTQTEPDWELEALIGEGNVPAYRGICYGVYTDRILTDWGNRPPLTEALIATNSTTSIQFGLISPYDSPVIAEALQGSQGNRIPTIEYSSKFDVVVTACHAYYGGYIAGLFWLDPYTKEVLHGYSLGGNLSMMVALIGSEAAGGQDWAIAYSSNTGYGTVWGTADGSYKYTFNTGGWGVKFVCETDDGFLMANAAGGVQIFVKQTGSRTYVSSLNVPPGYVLSTNDLYGAYAGGNILTPIKQSSPSRFAVAILKPLLTGGSGSDHFWDEPQLAAEEINAFVARPCIDDNGLVWWPVNCTFTGGSGGGFWVTDSRGANGELVSLYDLIELNGWSPWYYSWTGHYQQCLTRNENTGRFCFQWYGSLWSLDPITRRMWRWSLSGAGATYYGAVTHHDGLNTYFSGTLADDVLTYSPDVYTVQQQPVADIIEDLCERAGLSSSEVDASAITMDVDGFAHTRHGPPKASISALLRIANAYRVSSDWQLKFLPLGANAVATIDVGDLGAREAGGDPVLPLETFQPASAEIPRSLTLRYLSSDADQQAAVVVAEVPFGNVGTTATAEFALAITDAEAAMLCKRLLQTTAGQYTHAFTLLPKYGYLDAGDCIVIPTSQGSTRVRLTSIDRGANGVIDVRAVSDSTDDLVAYVVAPGSGYKSQSVTRSGPAKPIVLDVHTLRDADDLDNPSPYLTAFAIGERWNGAQFYQSPDNSDFTAIGVITAKAPAGFCQTIPVPVYDFESYDTQTIRVRIQNGAPLFSVTESALLQSNANVAAWGQRGRWEIVQFKDALPVVGQAGDYDLTNLLRGRRGSTANMRNHGQNDVFILLTEQTVIRQELATANIGETWYYKAPQFASNLANAITVSDVLANVPAIPYAPCNANWEHTNNIGRTLDFTFEWRTRKGGKIGGANGLTDGVAGSMTDEDTGDFETLDEALAPISTYQVSGESHQLTDAQIAADYDPIVPHEISVRIAQDGSDSGALGAWYFKRGIQLGSVALAEDGGEHACLASVQKSTGDYVYVGRIIRASDGSYKTVI